MQLPSFQLNTRRYGLLLGTILLIAITFTLYYLVYVPSRTEIVNGRNFRVLTQLAQNIQTKEQNLYRVTNNYFKSVADSVHCDCSKLSNDFVLKNNLTTYDETSLSFQNLARVKLQDKLYSTSYSTGLLAQGYSSMLLFSVIDNPCFKNKNDSTSWYRFTAKFPVGEFMRMLISTNFLKQYLIIDTAKRAGIIYQNGITGIAELKVDSLMRKEHGVLSADLKEITIAGNRYELYILPVQLVQNKTSLLCGLVSARDYNNDRFNLPDVVLLKIIFL